jgi:transposase-like protein
MNPQEQVCHNPRCWVYGRSGAGEIVIHSQKGRRSRCKRCGTTFSATTQTPFYRLHHPHALVVIVITLLAYGCPVQAIVAAFGLDERTVADWQRRAGRHAARRAPERVHDHLVQAGAVTLGQVQADELRVRIVGGIVWLAMSVSVASRLWLGGAVSATRDRALIHAALTRVAACGPVAALLLCTDGLRSYPRQAVRAFRQPVRTSGRGRPRLVLPAGVLIAQMVKRYARRRVCAVERRIVRGGAAAVATMLAATQGTETAVLNTAYIERLNATFRARLIPLVRRSRATVRRVATLEGAGALWAGWLVGNVYNFCTPHRSLGERTPAQVAGLTDHRWTVHELLTFPLPLPGVKRRGRPPHWLRELPDAA